ncbi:MAG TPA: transglutaminase-like domain-containing protein [Hymenobacter sp.]|jgi:hypothetical protein|uniref:transglutaminase-like domain-containing protein n=1 Tax=Hymenobacter sp. TaxID=1898978 RepID=UPI002ED9E2F0
MKILLAALVCFCWSLAVRGQASYRGLPVIKAASAKADYRIGKFRTKGNWNISPQIAADSLLVACWSGPESFAFYTDTDSIAFTVRPNQVRSFYVLLNGSDYALTVVKGQKPAPAVLAFDAKAKNDKLQVWYEQNNNNEYLQRLLANYPLQRLIANAKTDTDKALTVLHWVHQQWQHNGNNEPRKNDAISILEEAKEGKLFRCVEYGIVATACLNAVGLKARVLALKTKDVETRASGAGHVLLEVYLNDLGKWAMLDGQWDAMPMRKGVPLNAVEFQQAVSRHYDEVAIASLSKVSKPYYVNWIYPYLYYFDVKFDNRENVGGERHRVDGKSTLMLVPAGAKNPTVFQRTNSIGSCLYTNSLKDFYAPPASGAASAQ